jgi:hypothetical protein
MNLMEKYAELLQLAVQVKARDTEVREEGGKLILNGVAEYQMDKDRFWDKIKTYPDWENDLVTDLKVANTDIYGYWMVKPGDNLTKIAEAIYSDAGWVTKIFEANKDILKDPNVIHPGQKLKIPKLD